MVFTMNKFLITGRRLLLPLFVVLLLGLSAIPALAATDTDTVSVTVSIGELVDLTLSTNSLTWAANEITAGRFDAGVSWAKDVTATVKSNTGWKLEIKGTSDYFSYSGSGTDPNKPVSDIQWRDGGSTYYDLSTTNAEVASDTGYTPGTDISLNIRIKLDWADDIPGTYTYDHILFTLSNV
jgi:hypothetical protein